MHCTALPQLAIAALFVSPLFLSVLGAAAKPKGYLVYIGTYTDKPENKGIYAYRFNAGTGELTSIGLVGETRNPSFLATDPANRFLYAVNELGDYQGKSAGSVTAFTMDRSTGKLTALNTVSTQGADPCHLMVDHTGRMLVVANYSGGSVASYPIAADGSLGEAASFIQHGLKGETPHAHCDVISPNNRFTFVADLGLDKIITYRIEPSTGKLTLNDPPSTSLPQGSGPRHFSIAPNHRFAYSINELKSTITAFHYDGDKGALTVIETVSTLPSGFTGENSTAELAIHPSGNFVYGSNRGHDSIAVFAVNKSSGKLTLVEHVPTQGRVPRGFALDPTGHFLLAANQKSDNLVLFAVDQKTGKLTPTGKTMSVGSPVCVIFVPQE